MVRTYLQETQIFRIDKKYQTIKLIPALQTISILQWRKQIQRGINLYKVLQQSDLDESFSNFLGIITYYFTKYCIPALQDTAEIKRERKREWRQLGCILSALNSELTGMGVLSLSLSQGSLLLGDPLEKPITILEESPRRMNWH